MSEPHNEKIRLDINEAIAGSNNDEIETLLANLSAAQIADIIESLPSQSRELIWPNIHFKETGNVLLEIGQEARISHLSTLTEEKIATIIETLNDVDDQADIILDLPPEKLARTLTILDKQKLKRLESVLVFEDGTAGGLMDLDHITIREDVSIDVVLRYLRIRAELPEHTDQLFVTNRHDKYLGVLLIRDLLTHASDCLVSKLMLRDVPAIEAETPDNEVAKHFEDENLVSAAVIANDGKIIGRITIDDVVDVIREEGEHSFMSGAGLSGEEDLFSPIIPSARRRALWLGVNLLTAFLASWVISFFQNTLDQIVVLAVLLTIVPSMGGIAGSQTLTIVIRALALNQLGSSNYKWLINKELAVSFLNGLVWSFIVSASTFLWFGNYKIALILGLALMINLLFGALAGATIPVIMKRFNIDPALAGGVALTTITDVVGVLAFLGLATLWLL